MLHQADDQFFLFGQAFVNQQRQGDQGVVVNQPVGGLGQKMLVQMQIPQKQKRPRALVAVGKRVVFDDKIQKMGGTAGDIGIKQRIAEALFDGADCRDQPVAADLPEQLRGFAFLDKRLFEFCNRRQHIIKPQGFHILLRRSDTA